LFSGQNLAGGETACQEDGQHVAELADSILGWGFRSAGPNPNGSKRQAEPAADPAGLTMIKFIGCDHVKFGDIYWKIGLSNCNSGRR